MKLTSNYYKNKPLLKFVDSVTKQILLTRELEYETKYRLSVMDTSKEREDFIPITKIGEYWYGPKQFLIDDGEYDPKGINKWIFDRVITEDTTVEVEMMKFDYYFETFNEGKNRINQICIDNNNDLSSKSFGFGDDVGFLEGFFSETNISSIPKIIFSRLTTTFLVHLLIVSS